MEQLLYSFLLDGVEIESYVAEGTKIELKQNVDDTDTARIVVSNTVVDTKVPVIGQSIIVSRGVSSATEKYKFRGNVKKIENSGDRIILTCKNTLNKLKFQLFTTSYDKNTDVEAGEYSAIAQDIIEDGGLTASVVASGAGVGDITADKFIVIKKTRFNRLALIARILDWNLKYDYDNDWVRLEPKGSSTYPNPLIVGTNVYNIPIWEQDLESMRNNITVNGAFVTDTKIETTVAGVAQTVFTTLKTPVNVELKVDGTLQVLGVVGATTGFDYTLDADKKTFTFVNALVGGESVVMTYTTNIPKPVTGKAYDSIEQYELEQEDDFDFKDIRTVDDAQTRLSQLLSILKDGRLTTKLVTDEYNIQPGDMIPVQDINQPTFNNDYVVYSITINYPDPVDSITIGSPFFDVNELFKTIDDRLKALEGTTTVTDEIIRQLFQIERQIRYERRYVRKQTRDTTEDGIWGRGFGNGVIGTLNWGEAGAVWQNSYTNSLIDERIVQGENTYKEYVVDSDFYDSSLSSGVTWNNTTNQISITTELITKPFDLGNVKSFYTVALANPSVTPTTYITGDNGDTWELLTLNVRTEFINNDGTGVRLKIVGGGGGGSWPTAWGTWGSTGSVTTLDNTYFTDLTFDQPSIQCILED